MSSKIPLLSAFLHQNGLDEVLGLRLLESRDPDVSVEVTEGISNIMMPRGAVDSSSFLPCGCSARMEMASATVWNTVTRIETVPIQATELMGAVRHGARWEVH